jgi:hypothetical protein
MPIGQTTLHKVEKKSKQRFLKKARKNFCAVTRGFAGRGAPSADRAWRSPACDPPRNSAKVFLVLFLQKKNCLN